MKVKLMCVNVPPKYEGFLTKGKIYEGEEVDDTHYYLVHNDRLGNGDYYLKSQHEETGDVPLWTVFIRLDNWRARKLKDIGI